MVRRLITAVLVFSVAFCASIGPGTVPHDRIDYASAIGDSWKQPILLKIVKLRYADLPIFLEVAQVIAGYQLQSTTATLLPQGTSMRRSSAHLRRPAPRPPRAATRIALRWFISRSPGWISCRV